MIKDSTLSKLLFWSILWNFIAWFIVLSILITKNCHAEMSGDWFIRVNATIPTYNLSGKAPKQKLILRKFPVQIIPWTEDTGSPNYKTYELSGVIEGVGIFGTCWELIGPLNSLRQCQVFESYGDAYSGYYTEYDLYFAAQPLNDKTMCGGCVIPSYYEADSNGEIDGWGSKCNFTMQIQR